MYHEQALNLSSDREEESKVDAELVSRPLASLTILKEADARRDQAQYPMHPSLKLRRRGHKR